MRQTFGNMVLVLGALTAQAFGVQDPWPHWQRTTNRIGNTNSIGPRNAWLLWTAQFTTEPNPTLQNGNVVINRYGHIVAGSSQGVAMLDPCTQKLVWEQEIGDSSGRVAIDGKRVITASGNPFGEIFCFDAVTGTVHWTRFTGGGFNSAPIIHDEIVYISDNGGRTLYALAIRDGSVLWGAPTEDSIYDSPSLDWPNLITSSGSPDSSSLTGFSPTTGMALWSFDTSREILGTSVLHDGRLTMGSEDRFLYNLSAGDGTENWRFWCEQINRGSVAVDHSDSIITGTTGNFGLLFSISPDGEQIWRKVLPGLISHAPIVDGENRVFVTSNHWTGSSYEGRVHGFLSDGTEQWVTLLPDGCRASPTLGPDGTLYVICRDNNLYAFRDPHIPGILTDLSVTTGNVESGDILDLDEIDENVLTLRSGFGRTLSDLHKLQMTIKAKITEPTFDVLRIQLKTWIDQPTGVGKVELKNWVTGQFETVRNYALEDTPFYEWIQIPKGGNHPPIDPRRYVRLSGEIEMRLTNIVFAPTLAFTFKTMLDQVKFEVTHK